MATPNRMPDARTPVLVGVGTASADAPVIELMADAALAAAGNTGAPGLLASLDRVMVPQGSWALTNPAAAVARQVGSPGARTVLCEIGVSQQEVINDALRAIVDGECEVVLVVGGESRAFERRGGAPSADAGAAPPDETLTRPADFVAPVELTAGIVWPVVQQYALIEQALGAHEELRPAEHAGQIAALWARCNEVAQTNPLAAFATPRRAADIATPGPKNRPLAWPYNLWHSSQWTVDQAGALLFCSAEQAASAGVPRDRWVFPRVALISSAALTLTARRQLHRWPAMAALGRAAETHLGLDLRDLPLADVYSCFPAAVRVQQRELGLDPGGTPTLTGGMTFAGGPFNNYVLQSTAALVDRLRAAPDELGLITTVSGMLSKPGLAVWSCTPPPDGPAGALIGDLAGQDGDETDRVPVSGPPAADTAGTVVSFTVTYGPDDPLQPTRTAIVADRADGGRTAATCEDEAIARLALAEGLIGQSVHLEDTTFRL